MTAKPSLCACWIFAGQPIVNEQTLRSGPANAIESDLKNLRVRLHVTDLAGDDHASSRSKKSCLWRGVGEGLCGPIAKSIQGISCLFQLLHDLHGTRKRFSERSLPMIVIRLDKVSVMRKFLREDRDTFCKGTTFDPEAGSTP